MLAFIFVKAEQLRLGVLYSLVSFGGATVLAGPLVSLMHKFGDNLLAHVL